ncbi:MAG: exosome complex protein Rrp42 [Candidatus Woesearchaeota archaeon]
MTFNNNNNNGAGNVPNSKEHFIKSLQEDVRYDTRAKTDFRDIKIETEMFNTAEGSARVTCGDTEILAGVKLSLGSPFPDRPDEGVLMVGCELLPIAHPSIESGPPSIDAIEISRVIDRGVRESGAVDVKNLCVEKGEKVWMISIDIVPINHDGNIIDLGGLAALAALKTMKFPEVDENGNIDYKKSTGKGVELKELPVPVTVCKVGDHFIVDPTKTEEDLLDARITVTSLDEQRICSLQKGGDVGMTLDEINQAFDLALEKGQELRQKLE